MPPLCLLRFVETDNKYFVQIKRYLNSLGITQQQKLFELQFFHE